MLIKFNDFGTHLGTRNEGREIRERLEDELRSSEEIIILDFNKIETVSNSFIDEALAKVLLNVPFVQFKKRTTFVNTNEFVRSVIFTTLKLRMAQPEFEY